LTLLKFAGSSAALLKNGIHSLAAVVPAWFSISDSVITIKWFDATLPEINKLIGEYYKGINN
jgi:hypothetical protein